MLCGNQCAAPGCTHQLVEGGISESGDEIVGQICHIYAASDDGPRGKPGLTDAEKNAFENLILLCGHHHQVIDKQPAKYPATALFEWKRAHEAKAKSGTPEAIRQEEQIQKHALMAEMSDEKIEHELKRVRQGRQLFGFPIKEEALRLAEQVDRSSLSGGHYEVRARALAWCARMLSLGDTLEKAKYFLSRAKDLASVPEIAFAEAFIIAATDKDAALARLAQLNTSAAKSAALRIVANEGGGPKALKWVDATRLTIDSFDPEGKFTYLMTCLLEGRWDLAIADAEKINEADIVDCPALMHVVSMAKLISTIEPDIRGAVLVQVPFEAARYPLASNPPDLVKRREARVLFQRISEFGRSIGGVPHSSNLASDYALWLGLRDPDEVIHAEALNALRESMRDPAISLRRINLALQFGVQIDTKAIEERIDQNIALSGKGSPDDAFARFSLAFAQGSHKGVADYIEKHRAQLYEHLTKTSILAIEIEALAKAGLIDSAKEKLEAAKDVLAQREQDTLARIVAEASGADPIAERRASYEARKDIQSLSNLVEGLEDRGLLQDLLPHAQELLSRIRTVDACERVARCLNNLSRYDDLLAFMTANQELVDQSENLRILWAWTLFREGRFSDAKAELDKLPEKSKNPNIKLLRINMAVASGAWEDLVGLANGAWDNRNEMSAMELLRAAQLSLAVNGAHSRELVEAATAKEPENPEVLAGAYFQATNAGWEQNQEVAGWLSKAADLSGDKGPIKMVSLKELLDMKPDWDKQSNSIWEQLKAGKIPVFAAAQFLNRSLLDFYLVPTLLNPSETDVRRRSVVFAYNGTRGSLPIGNLKKLALDLGAIVTLSQLGLLEAMTKRFEIIIPHSTLGWLFQEKQRATFHQPSRIKDAALLKQLVANGSLHVLNVEGPRNDTLIREVGSDLAALLTAAKARSSGEKKILVVKDGPIHRNGSLMLEEADISGYENNLTSCYSVIERMKLQGALTSQEEDKARAYLKLHAKPWPDEPPIEDGTEIYLDGVAVSHLRAAGILAKFKAANVKAYIDNPENEEADGLLALQTLSVQQLEAIDKIRSALAVGLAAGTIRAVRTSKVDDDDKNLLNLHPTYEVLGLAEKAEGIVVDDRFINQHRNMTAGDKAAPLFTTLDILDHLRSIGDIRAEQLFSYRISLRQWGYQLITVTDEELDHHLSKAQIKDGHLIETGELKAIRQSLQRARMGKLVQFPLEIPFLHNSLGAFIRAMKRKWVRGSVEDAKIWGNYLLTQFDVRSWAPSALPGNERGFAIFAHASYALQITSPPVELDDIGKALFYEWIEDAVLEGIKNYQPEVFRFMTEKSREMVIDAANNSVKDEPDGVGDDESGEA